MSQTMCSNCNSLFKDKDEVRAVIISRYVSLKSKAIYALEKPTECLELVHKNCNWPQGEVNE